MYSWGYNFYSECGHADTNIRLFPHLVKPMMFTSVSNVAASAKHTVAVLDIVWIIHHMLYFLLWYLIHI